MSEALIKYETIDEGQIKDIMEGRDPKPPAGWDDSAPRRSAAVAAARAAIAKRARSPDRQAGQPALSLTARV